jgi:hypothetical protein
LQKAGARLVAGSVRVCKNTRVFGASGLVS